MKKGRRKRKKVVTKRGLLTRENQGKEGSKKRHEDVCRIKTLVKKTMGKKK